MQVEVDVPAGLADLRRPLGVIVVPAELADLRRFLGAIVVPAELADLRGLLETIPVSVNSAGQAVESIQMCLQNLYSKFVQGIRDTGAGGLVPILVVLMSAHLNRRKNSNPCG